jgi:uncharacterized membrane protein YhaH (DUF805 family)
MSSAMTRTRYLIISAALVGAASLIALAIAPPSYQCWIADRRLPASWGDWVASGEYCYRFDSGRFSIFFPMFMIPLATLLPIAPTLARLRALGHSRAWALIGFLPGINLLLYAFVLLRAGPERSAKPTTAAHVSAAVLCPAAAFLYYHVCIYFLWLAART